MSEIIYYKLVRDRIPEIIAGDNQEAVTETLGSKDYIQALFEKLFEEGREARQAGGTLVELTKEIGDIYEVIDAIIDFYGLDRTEIARVKNARKETRGGFEKRIFLKYIKT